MHDAMILAGALLMTNDVVTRAAIVEGYNTNTYQAQDDPNVPIIRRHPSPFTGVDLDVELRHTSGRTDLTTLRLEGRANHYEPLNGSYQSDDGTINGAVSSRYTLAPRTFFNFVGAATLTTLNGSHLTDGTIFQFDPTQVRRTYWLTNVDASITHELSHTWRIRQSIAAIVSGTVYQPARPLPNGELEQHRGLDFVMPSLETDVFKDFSERATGDLELWYQYSYNLYVLDLTQSPPRNIGPDKIAFLTGLAGYTYRFSPELVTVTKAGGVIASAPPRDVDQRPILSPAVLQEVYYTRELWAFIGNAGYTWGTVNPRLGSGPTANVGALVVGTPYRVGKWRDFDVILSAQASYSQLVTGVGTATKLGLYAGAAEFRYGISPWLGILGGYDVRYATFDTPQYAPPFLQHIVFFGFSGYWSTDRAIPALTTFTAPVTPPA
jgi:hypothetical protein